MRKDGAQKTRSYVRVSFESRVGSVRLLLKGVHRARKERSACHENVERVQNESRCPSPWARHMIFAYNNGRVWCGQIRARQLRPTTAFVAEMTEAWRGEFQKGVKKFEDGNYESAILFFTAVSIQCVPCDEMAYPND